MHKVAIAPFPVVSKPKAMVATYHDLVRRDVLADIPAQAGRVLDFGGGMGATSAALRASGRATHTVLFDQVANGADPHIDAAETLDLENGVELDSAFLRHGPFDTILCLDILEHLRDPWTVMSCLTTSLAPGGSMVISLPNASHYQLLGPLLLNGRFDYIDAGLMDRTHLRWFTRKSAMELATCSGLRLEFIKPNIRGRKNHLLNNFSAGLLGRFVTAQYTLRARKD